MRKILVSIFSVVMIFAVCFLMTASTYKEKYITTFTPEVITKPLINEMFVKPVIIEEIKEEILPPVTYDGTVYLTFDDGPVPEITSQILDILKKYDVKATFFMLGSYAKRNPNMTKRVYDEGHTIGTHSYSHKDTMFNSLANFKWEIEESVNVLEGIINDEIKYFRIPYGTKIGQTYKDYLDEKGLSVVKWNCESYDSRVNTKTPEQILKGVKDTMPKNKDVIVIMHDTYGKQKTVDALPSIIEYFKELNYEFKKF